MHWPHTIGIGCILLASAGCAATWDEITSRERDFAYITGWGKPNPLVVIRDSNDGARRAEAITELREPLRHGGNAQDQEAYLNILNKIAKEDREPICRLAAIRALGKFKDPRAARTLEEVYHEGSVPATPDNLRVVRFNQDINSMIRKEALVGLEAIHDPESRHLLIRVARQPGPAVSADTVDRQQTQDEKVVAIRALKHYRQQESIDALVHVLKSEKDVALRDCALNSLEDVTGKKWPADRETWLREDVRPQPSMAGESSVIQRVTNIFQK